MAVAADFFAKAIESFFSGDGIHKERGERVNPPEAEKRSYEQTAQKNCRNIAAELSAPHLCARATDSFLKMQCAGDQADLRGKTVSSREL